MYLLEALSSEQLSLPLQKGKSVEGQFAHVHNVRLMWLKASAPELNEKQQQLEGTNLSKDAIAKRLGESSAAIRALIEQSIETGKLKNFKPHVTAFVAYLVAHDANHRAHIELALRQAGSPLPEKVAYGLWEWASR